MSSELFFKQTMQDLTPGVLLYISYIGMFWPNG